MDHATRPPHRIFTAMEIQMELHANFAVFFSPSFLITTIKRLRRNKNQKLFILFKRKPHSSIDSNTIKLSYSIQNDNPINQFFIQKLPRQSQPSNKEKKQKNWLQNICNQINHKIANNDTAWWLQKKKTEINSENNRMSMKQKPAETWQWMIRINAFGP